MKKDVVSHNKKAWDLNVEMGIRWSTIVSEEEIQKAKEGNPRIIMTPTKAVPLEWMGELKNKNILGLASGGGQQGPLLAAAGAKVTIVDLSPKQLEQDQKAAEKYGLEIKTVETKASDLSMFADESFDLIINPVSNCFFEDLNPVWDECARVLKADGKLIWGFNNPVAYLFDYDLANFKDKFHLKYKQPYSDLDSLSEEEKKKFLATENPLEFGHSLELQIGELLKRGFMLGGLYEDYWDDETEALNNYFPQFITGLAIKRSSYR